ncbi:MAG: rRNA maturation RNase YbeY, partial [Lachnospiraceae bacterium]|nr:rRNA maturation RNase YbeY [Lachnospiraceae bacterium]
PTDVLSFPMINYEAAADFGAAEEDMDCFDPVSGELLLGDIIISAEKVREQADKYGHSLKREFAFLVAHSMLHLCGYDHMTREEAQVMEEKQEQALNGLGITRDNG